MGELCSPCRLVAKSLKNTTGSDLIDTAKLPKEYIEGMRRLLGDDLAAFLRCMEEPSVSALLLNPWKRQSTVALPFETAPMEDVCGGFFIDSGVRPGANPLHEAGLYYVQEPSAMRAAAGFDVRADDFVLDICAAPGGKSVRLCSLVGEDGFFAANEIAPTRAKVLSENLERMGMGHALILNESPQKLAEKFGGFFTKILVDAPCSGEGMFRKNPDTISEWSPDAVSMCHRRQVEILSQAARMLAPGGEILYCTCTFNALENEGSVDEFLRTHSGFSIVRLRREYPHLSIGEGHFSVLLRNEGELLRPSMSTADKLFAAPELEGIIRKKFQRLEQFGDYLCAVQKNAPPIDFFKGLKIVRCGLQLFSREGGKVKRTVPAHALAMAISPEAACLRIDLSQEQARRYIAGEAIGYSGQKGWALLCCEGLPLGWGKAIDGRIQNYRPKGLRKVL